MMLSRPMMLAYCIHSLPLLFCCFQLRLLSRPFQLLFKKRIVRQVRLVGQLFLIILLPRFSYAARSPQFWNTVAVEVLSGRFCQYASSKKQKVTLRFLNATVPFCAYKLHLFCIFHLRTFHSIVTVPFCAYKLHLFCRLHLCTFHSQPSHSWSQSVSQFCYFLKLSFLVFKVFRQR